MRKYPVELIRKPELIIHEPASPTEASVVAAPEQLLPQN
ncbi:hypothetical protein Pla111_14770 [Botrimarina hoheduenensis]|uniref:Uncharacterized protein n=1 Tax=Botrimarina hoheduenensis TaxID=2528000 RepID=A0A5C5WCR8_9BACT|nr:hypothetical protein Pla111_14770 [Botrimarina hoheduenensis]